MLEPQDREAILREPREQEKSHDWLGAAQSYKTAIAHSPEGNASSLGHIQEALGFALYRAAFQAEIPEDFRARIADADSAYREAVKFYDSSDKPSNVAGKLRCLAMLAFLRFWLVPSAEEKKKLVDDAWNLAKESMKVFEEAQEFSEFGKTYNRLSLAASFGWVLGGNAEGSPRILEEAVEHGEKAVDLLSRITNAEELVRALVIVACHREYLAESIPDFDLREKYYQKDAEDWSKACEIDRETSLLELCNCLRGVTFGEGWGTDKALEDFSKGLENARNTRDKLLTGSALDLLAYHIWWRCFSAEDPDERKALAQKALAYAEDAKRDYSVISLVTPRAGHLWVDAPYAEYYWQMAAWEMDAEMKRSLLARAYQAAPEALRRAEDSGYPEVKRNAHHVFSKILASLAKIETSAKRKRQLLEQALVHRNESISLTRQLEPFNYWSQGMTRNYLADIKSELAEAAEDRETKISSLKDAAEDKEASLRLFMKEVEIQSSSSQLAVLGTHQYGYGDLLSRLYELGGDPVQLEKVVAAFETAAGTFQKTGMESRAAECFWRAAQAYDGRNSLTKAAECFNRASTSYRGAAQKILQLKDFYEDHASYMEAWSEIEKARHHHIAQEYGLARQNYEKVATLHKLTKEWDYLASNYQAWAVLENAEDLSRQEQLKESVHAFRMAAKLFRDSKEWLRTRLSKIHDSDEKQMVGKLIGASDLRHEYCQARILLEEAKMLERTGERYPGAERFAAAAEYFERVARMTEHDDDKREVELVKVLCRAWEKMARAEAEVSPLLYEEATKLFEEARKHSRSEKGNLLLLGHSRFCKALEAGTKFTDNRDQAQHALAVQNLETAGNYYLKAGFQNASDYAKASRLLFDAYQTMDKADREEGQKSKARLYAMAERILRASAESFEKSAYRGKAKEVVSLLDKVKEKREMAISLMDVLEAPPIVSAAESFVGPTQTPERSVGLARFAVADVQASVTIPKNDVLMGEDLDFEIELVNAGRGVAQLVRIEDAIPEGFELSGRPGSYKRENGNLDMRGKQLAPLKTEEVKIVLRPKVKGRFLLKPRVFYFDENGKFRLHEPEPREILVKELGIFGWVKGQ